MLISLCKRVKIFYGENENDKVFSQDLNPFSPNYHRHQTSNTTSSKKCQLLEDLLDVHNTNTAVTVPIKITIYLGQAIIQTHNNKKDES